MKVKCIIMKDFNSVVNQDIKRKFVEREVFANVNSMVEYILRQDGGRDAPFTYDDIENLYTHPEYFGKYANFKGGTEEKWEEEISRLKTIEDQTPEDELSQLAKEIEELEELETEPQEIYEYWLVSGYLIEKLKEQGECVIECENIWCRGTTGQAILLDGVISRICSDMEILEGQENDWSK